MENKKIKSVYEIDWDSIYKKLKKEEQSNKQWKEINKEEFIDKYRLLPVVKYKNGGFFISEVYTFNDEAYHFFYQAYRGKYFKCLKPLNKNRRKIIKDLRNFYNLNYKN